ncbi:MAG: nitrate reductase molybdenum cofactor assembly chaperone [Syntrophobacterales bacterium]|jgi:nitrate reductase molybdenum cofactor assembly chaperone
MNDDKRYLLKVLSVLLQYPDEELMLNFEEIGEAVEKIAQVKTRKRYTNFLKYLEETPLIRLQEEYTVTFDFNPATSLNLTYHKWGDTRERGKALVGFHQLYETAGYESTSGELPDYLPLLLEFLSINSQECDFSFLGQYCDQLKAIGVHLQESGSPYTGLFEIVLDIFRELKTNGA